MGVYISLLKGINVGGNKIIKMEALRVLYESLGFGGVTTLLQSGNVVFATEQGDAAALAAQIEAGIAATFGFESKIILRTAQQWRGIIDTHPFTAPQLAEPSKLLVSFLSEAPQPSVVAALLANYGGAESVYERGTELYIYYPDGMGRSKLDQVLSDRKLGVTQTGRNWNTVGKLMAMVERMG
jgi:uncharacterized protein (DUF1697 family)